MSNSGYNTMSTIMVPIILSTIQHHRETSYNNSQYTTYIQRYASNHSILGSIEISRYLSLYSDYEALKDDFIVMICSQHKKKTFGDKRRLK